MKATVVGAGVVGCSVAYELASRGAEVHVIDPRGVGQGATRASAGVLAPHIEGRHEALRRLGVRSLELYESFIRRVSSDGQQSIEYERAGTFEVARDEHETRALHETARQLAAMQVPHTLFDGASARRVEPGLAETVTAALLIPAHGYVAAVSLMSALSSAAERRGVTFSRMPVEALESTGRGACVRTSHGTIESNAVVLAAGSWSGQLSIPASPVRPIRGQLLHLRVPHRPASRVIWGTGCYLVPWTDGSVLVGATVEDVGFDETATVSGVSGLLQAACELLPALGSARFEEVRVGLRPATPDELPVIGSSATMPGVFYATGHFRNGVLLAPLTANLIADLVLDGRLAPELELVRPDRFNL